MTAVKATIEAAESRTPGIEQARDHKTSATAMQRLVRLGLGDEVESSSK